MRRFRLSVELLTESKRYFLSLTDPNMMAQAESFYSRSICNSTIRGRFSFDLFEPPSAFLLLKVFVNAMQRTSDLLQQFRRAASILKAFVKTAPRWIFWWHSNNHKTVTTRVRFSLFSASGVFERIYFPSMTDHTQLDPQQSWLLLLLWVKSDKLKKLRPFLINQELSRLNLPRSNFISLTHASKKSNCAYMFVNSPRGMSKALLGYTSPSYGSFWGNCASHLRLPPRQISYILQPALSNILRIHRRWILTFFTMHYLRYHMRLKDSVSSHLFWFAG